MPEGADEILMGMSFVSMYAAIRRNVRLFEADVIDLLGGKGELANENNSPGLKRRLP